MALHAQDSSEFTGSNPTGHKAQDTALKRAELLKCRPLLALHFEPQAAGLHRAGHRAPLLPADVGEGLRHRPGKRDGMLDREGGKAEK